MKTIGDLLTRDLSRRIEEVIQVDQDDEQAVYEEIDEYIATDSIRRQYADLLKAIAEAPTEQSERHEVWVSGFFGSGKSSFSKNLGLALQNRPVCGEEYASLFKKAIGDETKPGKQVGELLDVINAQYPTEVILFEVAKERDTRKVTERIAELMYTVLLRELGYAEDFDIAELEIELESEGKLDEFVEKCQELHGKGWEIVRKGAQKISRASAVLNALDPTTYPTADSWSHAQRKQEASITVNRVVDRTFELMGRRRPGKAIVFIIDEVGQHVARSGDKIEDLRATVEQFGKVGKALLKKREIPAPCWIVVTSQEKLDEVVAAIDSKRVELAKLQDRFRHRIDLAPSDIREVATKRVLAKEGEKAVPALKKLFNDNQGSLNASLRLERTQRKTEITEDDFVQFYPYPPHYIDICIGIMSGVRLQPGAPRHYGGSNRTIIKQAYEMLVSERTNLAAQPVGTLVTLDRVFELVEGNLSNEKRTDIHEIADRFSDDPEGEWCLRVAKVVCLLEFIRDLPRTESNIAAFLIDKVGDHSPTSEVQSAVKKLQQAQFIRNTEDGWKLQTAQEKNWETERRSHLDPKPRERNDLVRTQLQDVFGEATYKTYRYKDFKTFRVGIGVDGVAINDGDLPVSLCIADDAEDLERKLTEVRDESRHKDHEDDIYWVFALTPEIDDLVAELHASRKMVEKYDQLRAQQKINSEEATTLQDEKGQALNHQSRLRDKLVEAMEQGTGVFQGVGRAAADLGKSLPEVLKKLYGHAVPDLYPKLEMGSRPLKGDEAEQILKAHDLKALPQVFYAGENGLGLVVKDGSSFVLDPEADIAKEVLGYIVGKHEYGDKDSRMGKALEKQFGGTRYGWDRDMLCLVLATLFRGGLIEVTHSGQKYDTFSDPRCRPCFTKAPAFRSSLFTPAKPPPLKTLKQAVLSYEEITGDTVEMESNAIAKKLKEFAARELADVLPIKAKADANYLPVSDVLQEYRNSLTTIENGSAEGCVNVLAGEGSSLKAARECIRKIGDCLEGKGLGTVQLARTATNDMWSVLESAGETEHAERVEQLRDLLASDTFYDSMTEIDSAAQAVASTYRSKYEERHQERAEQFQSAIEKIKGHSEWGNVPENMREPVLKPLVDRCCTDLELLDGGLVCTNCRATLAQMESDLAALGGLFADAVAQVQKLTSPPETRIERVRVSEFFTGSIESEDQVKQSVERLQDHLLKLLDEGVKIVLE